MNFMQALTLAFIVLKLCGVITWSWLLVTLPMWGAFILAMLFVIVADLSGSARKSS